MDTRTRFALAELRDAVAFFDRLNSLKGKERNAVGTDHYDRLIAAARAVGEATKHDDVLHTN